MLQIALSILMAILSGDRAPASTDDQAPVRCDTDDDDSPPDAAPRRPQLGGGRVNDAACKAAGGSCVAISSCAKGHGSMAEPSCGASGIVCCVADCGEEDFSCCDHSAKFRPVCRDGKLECRDGQSRCE